MVNKVVHILPAENAGEGFNSIWSLCSGGAGLLQVAYTPYSAAAAAAAAAAGGGGVR